MNVANLDLCRELYKLSGWELPEPQTVQLHTGDDAQAIQDAIDHVQFQYDLGYLLRKLPEFYEEGKIAYLLTVQPNPIGAGWQAHYRFASRTPNSSNTGSRFRQDANTPEDAAAKLCIELFKQGVLPKETK